MKDGPRKVPLGNHSWLSDFFSQVRTDGLPVTEPSQAMMIAQITNI